MGTLKTKLALKSLCVQQALSERPVALPWYDAYPQASKAATGPSAARASPFSGNRTLCKPRSGPFRALHGGELHYCAPFGTVSPKQDQAP